MHFTMRFATVGALGALCIIAACATSAPPSHHGRYAGRHARGEYAGGGDSQSGGAPAAEQRAPSLFVSPMGEPFHANASGARGIDLWIAEADTDYDHRISHAEFMANVDAFFAVLDANHDGSVTSLEDTAFWQREAPEIVSDGYTGPPVAGNDDIGAHHHSDTNRTTLEDGNHTIPGATGMHRERPQGAQAYGLLGDAEPVMSCDANFDGRVTRTEWDACAEQRFAQLDANHDGYIVPDEMHLWGSQRAEEDSR